MDNGLTRECGECTVCCVYPRIDDPELQKPGMAHCPNLILPGPEEPNKAYYTGGNGCENCKIYSGRPRPCMDYQCAWRLGFGGENDRPDKVLMLFDKANGIENSLEAKPLADGQEDTPEGHAVIDRMSRSAGTPVIVLNFYERRIQRIAGKSV